VSVAIGLSRPSCWSGVASRARGKPRAEGYGPAGNKPCPSWSRAPTRRVHGECFANTRARVAKYCPPRAQQRRCRDTHGRTLRLHDKVHNVRRLAPRAPWLTSDRSRRPRSLRSRAPPAPPQRRAGLRSCRAKAALSATARRTPPTRRDGPARAGPRQAPSARAQRFLGPSSQLHATACAPLGYCAGRRECGLPRRGSAHIAQMRSDAAPSARTRPCARSYPPRHGASRPECPAGRR
jgi:hypothetical protein